MTRNAQQQKVIAERVILVRSRVTANVRSQMTYAKFVTSRTLMHGKWYRQKAQVFSIIPPVACSDRNKMLSYPGAQGEWDDA
jgi:hypothetical protein